MNNRSLLTHHFPFLTNEQVDQLSSLEEAIKSWNEKINVISRKDLDNLMERHIIHSLALIKVLQLKPGTWVLDAGTGGGLPGLPLAIVFRDTNFHLVDSTRKKLDVVSAISDNLGLNNVTTEHARLEKVNGPYDFVLGRAVTNLPQFLAWSKKTLQKGCDHHFCNGIFYWKGGPLEPEIAQQYPDYRLFYLNELFDPPLFDDKYLFYSPKG